MSASRIESAARPDGARLMRLMQLAAAVAIAVLSAWTARYGIVIPPLPEQPGQKQPEQKQPEQKQPEQPPAPRPDPVAAIVRIQFGTAGCSATIIGPAPSDGRWWVLTAAHCLSGVNQPGTMRLKDGRTVALVVVAIDRGSDCAWCRTEPVTSALPFALLARRSPSAGVRVWHMGYGTDRPGNREDGVVIGGPDADGQIVMTLSVSPGDSGGGIIDAATGEVVSCVCCTERLAARAKVWGASVESITRLRSTVAQVGDWQPVEMPSRPPDVPDVLPDPGQFGPKPADPRVKDEKRSHRIALEPRSRGRLGDWTAEK